MADTPTVSRGGYPVRTERTEFEQRRSSDLADVLERVLDKGVVIAGDITIDLLRIELLTIRLRLLIASADKAREMGIDWWAADPYLSSGGRAMDEDARALKERLDRLEKMMGPGSERENGADGSRGSRGTSGSAGSTSRRVHEERRRSRRDGEARG